jgi:hypothetical protein
MTKMENVVKITIHPNAQNEFKRQSEKNSKKPIYRISIIGYG